MKAGVDWKTGVTGMTAVTMMPHAQSTSLGGDAARAPVGHGAPHKSLLSRWSDFAPVLVLIALVLGFSAAAPNFFSTANFARISIASMPALMVAVGATFIIIMGSIDLSMEGVVSTTAVLFAFVFNALGGALFGL